MCHRPKHVSTDDGGGGGDDDDGGGDDDAGAAAATDPCAQTQNQLCAGRI